MSARAITYGGRRTFYSNEKLQDMLDNPEMYEMADNLPKWLAVKFMTTKQLRFDAAYAAAMEEIDLAKWSDHPVTFNVRSDRPYRSTKCQG